MMCGGPAAAALLPGFIDVEDSKPLPHQIRTVRSEERLATKMLMALWTSGTFSLGDKWWAVASPFYLLSKKTLPARG